jgi:ABC-2 type transport system permease protein
MSSYSQLRAMLAITKASLKAIFRSPSAVIFSFGFPFIFILVFGFIGGSGNAPVYKVALEVDCDTANVLFDSLKSNTQIRIVRFKDTVEMRDNLVKAKITGIVGINKTNREMPAYTYSLRATTASMDRLPQLNSLLANINSAVSNAKYKDRPSYSFETAVNVETVREYTTIDFILPGQLGFSLLSSGVFGVAFMFFCNTYQPHLYSFGRRIGKGAFSNAHCDSDHFSRPFLFWVYIGKWVNNIAEYAVPEFYWPGSIYGFGLHCKWTCKK